jgi:hypothetical protein
MPYEFGDIVLVPFPFTSQTAWSNGWSFAGWVGSPAEDRAALRNAIVETIG